MFIKDYLKKECIRMDMEARDKEDLLRQLARLLLNQCPGIDEKEAVTGLLEREKVMSTGIGHGIAIPHARLSSCDKIYVGFGRVHPGIDYGAVDNNPVTLVFLIFFPKDEVNLQLRFLARISRILNQESLRQQLSTAETPEKVISVLGEFEESHFH